MPAKGYFIKIEEHQGNYVFQLWYTNKQPMGYSRPYHSHTECVEGIRSFKKYLRENNPAEGNTLVKIIKKDIRKYVYEFYDLNGHIVYTSREIISVHNCRRSMFSTCKNFPYADFK
jgi:uncharacterized protein YegP (UPF0339 family)